MAPCNQSWFLVLAPHFRQPSGYSRLPLSLIWPSCTPKVCWIKLSLAQMLSVLAVILLEFYAVFKLAKKTSCGSLKKKRGTTSGAKLNTVCDEYHHRSRPDRRIMRLGVCERRQLLPVVLPTYETTKSPFENGITYRNGTGPLSFLVVGSGYTTMDSGSRC